MDSDHVSSMSVAVDSSSSASDFSICVGGGLGGSFHAGTMDQVFERLEGSGGGKMEISEPGCLLVFVPSTSPVREQKVHLT